MDYIPDNADLVSRELESFVNDQEVAVKAHDYLTSFFAVFFDFRACGCIDTSSFEVIGRLTDSFILIV